MPCSSFIDEEELSEEELNPRKRELSKKEVPKIIESANLRSKDESGSCVKSTWLQKSSDKRCDWFPFNPFLTSDQRGPTPCYTTCFKSAFQNNTEACNVWTHFIAGVFTMYSWYQYHQLPSSLFINEKQEKFVASVIYIGFTICFFFSSIFHMFYCHSRSVHNFTLRMDLTGILLAVSGSYVPWLYYSFYNDFNSQAFYGTCLLFALPAAFYVLMKEEYLSKENFSIRLAVITCLPLISLLGFTQICMRDGFQNAWNAGHKHHLGLFFWNLIGITFLGTKIPERYLVGRFDGWVHSHPIFHVLCSVAGFHAIWFTHRMRENLLHGLIS